MSRISPGMPNATVTSAREVYGDRLGLKVTVDPETFEQFRTGYRCLKCYAAQEHAWPEECVEPYCRFPIREKQADLIEFEFRGEETLWPDREPMDNPSGMWLPGDS